MECEMKNLSRRLLLILTLLLPAIALVSSASFAATKVEATIFVRTQTTLSEDGQSAANTKLDRDSAAYKALVEKRSYAGVVTLFGHDYRADYAPLTSESGDLTGALFVGVPK
jgi:hypothetical protein